MPGFCPTSYRYHRRTRGFCNFPSRQSKQENSLTKMTNKYIICRSFKSFWLNELSIIKENYTMPRRKRQGTCICSFFFFKYVSYNHTKFVKRQYIELYIVLFLRYEFCEFFVVLFNKQEAHGPHRSPEKTVQINRHI